MCVLYPSTFRGMFVFFHVIYFMLFLYYSFCFSFYFYLQSAGVSVKESMLGAKELGNKNNLNQYFQKYIFWSSAIGTHWEPFLKSCSSILKHSFDSHSKNKIFCRILLNIFKRTQCKEGRFHHFWSLTLLFSRKVVHATRMFLLLFSLFESEPWQKWDIYLVLALKV